MPPKFLPLTQNFFAGRERLQKQIGRDQRGRARINHQCAPPKGGAYSTPIREQGREVGCADSAITIDVRHRLRVAPLRQKNREVSRIDDSIFIEIARHSHRGTRWQHELEFTEAAWVIREGMKTNDERD